MEDGNTELQMQTESSCPPLTTADLTPKPFHCTYIHVSLHSNHSEVTKSQNLPYHMTETPEARKPPKKMSVVKEVGKGGFT